MMRLKVPHLKMLASALVVAVSGSVVQANLLSNAGFEDPVTYDGPPFVGFWEAFSGGGTAASFNSTVMPLSGAQHLELVIDNQANNFAGAFQDVEGLSEGEEITFSVWAKNVGLDSGGSEMRIEWRDSVSNTEISRTPNLVPSLTSEYTLITLTDNVPAGADTARVVYAIQSFGGALNQNVYLDDASVIPEPASMALLGLGGLALLRRRA